MNIKMNDIPIKSLANVLNERMLDYGGMCPQMNSTMYNFSSSGGLLSQPALHVGKT